MGSVLSNIQCPNCSSENCMEDFYYSSNECYAHCPDCGYHYSATIINRDKLRSGEDKEVKWEEKQIKNPYSAFEVVFENNSMQCGTFESEKQFYEGKESILKYENIKSFSISRFVNGEIEKQLLFESKGLKQEIKKSYEN